ncbi:MAG: cellulose biosynthesis cyclic di-GMP-binding regulatory protein BcsB [Pseudomonadota bacterium]
MTARERRAAFLACCAIVIGSSGLAANAEEGSPAAILRLLQGDLPPAADEIAPARPSRPAGPGLAHLPPLQGDARLEGEIDGVRWTLPVTAEQAERGVTLRLAQTSALAVAPELSTLDLTVNGIPVDSHPIDAPEGAARDIAIPAEVLVPGYNAVDLTARQRHRVDCSAEATYELWTDIDLARSGIVAAIGARYPTLDDLAALPREPDGGITIRIVQPTLDAAGTAATLTALRNLVRGSGFEKVSVLWGDTAEGQATLDLFVGPSTRWSGLGRAELTTTERPILVDATQGRPTTVLVATDRPEPARALATFAATGPRGSVHGMEERERAQDVAVPGERRSFASFGLVDETFVGQRYSRAFDLRLPADAYPADYGDVEFELAFAHVAGLRPGSEVRVRINGAIRASLALTANERRVHRRKSLQIPLGAFRPGVNRVAIEATLADAADLSCAPLDRVEAKPRFALSAQSTLRLPKLASVVRENDLAGLTAGSTTPLDLIIPTPDAASLSAAATLSLGFDAGTADLRPVRLGLGLGAVEQAGKDAVIVAPLEALPTAFADAIPGLAPGALQTAWMPSEADAIGRLAARQAPRRADAADPTLEVALSLPETERVAPTIDVLSDWEAFNAGAPTSEPEGLWETILGAAPDLGEFLDRPEMSGQELSAVLQDPGDAILARIEQPDGRTATLLTARDGDALMRAALGFGDPAHRDAITGAAIAFSETEAGSQRLQGSWGAEGPRWRPGSFSPGNLRLILAGWFSDNAFAYAALMLGALVVAGGATSQLLGRVGRRFDAEGVR